MVRGKLWLCLSRALTLTGIIPAIMKPAPYIACTMVEFLRGTERVTSHTGMTPFFLLDKGQCINLFLHMDLPELHHQRRHLDLTSSNTWI
jgi:hypothetical protein